VWQQFGGVLFLTRWGTIRCNHDCRAERCSTPIEQNQWLALRDQWLTMAQNIDIRLHKSNASGKRLMRRAASLAPFPGKEWSLDELMPDEEQTAEAVQRMAMALLDLPREERVAQYPLIRRNFEASLRECGLEGATANAWLDSTIIGIRILLNRIENSGGAVGGQA